MSIPNIQNESMKASSGAVLPLGEAPFSLETITITKTEYIHLRWEAQYWKSQYGRVVKRDQALKAKNERFQARIRDLIQRLYGRKGFVAKFKIFIFTIILW